MRRFSRIKLTSDSHSLGTFQALEFLALGILGKLALWDALKALQEVDSRLQGTDFNHLATRVRTQQPDICPAAHVPDFLAPKVTISRREQGEQSHRSVQQILFRHPIQGFAHLRLT